jgi:hypothetical protein
MTYDPDYQRAYRESHREERKAYRARYFQENKTTIYAATRERNRKNRSRVNATNRRRYREIKADPDRWQLFKERQRRWRLGPGANTNSGIRRRKRIRLKLAVLTRLGGPRCVRCGCTDIRLLDVNHIGGVNANEDRRHGTRFYEAILSGVVSSAGLNVLCRPCNILDYVERKWPELAGTYALSWTPNGREFTAETAKVVSALRVSPDWARWPIPRAKL